MSQKFRKVRLLAGASAVAALALPASAMAVQSSTLNYTCKFPLIGSKPLKLDIKLDLPDRVEQSEETGEFGIDATATAGGDTGGALGIVAGLRWLKGVNTPDPVKGMTAFAHVEKPGGGKIAVNVPVFLDPYEVIPPVAPDVVFHATSTTPSLTLDDEGTHKVVFDKLQLNLSGTDVDGNPIEGLTTPTKDNSLPTPLAFADTDRPAGMPAEEDPTFNVPCRLDPVGQNLTIGQFDVWHGDPVDTPPTAPGEGVDYTEADFTATSINLRWTAATDDHGIDHYVITYDGVDGIQTVTAPGNATSKLITGLGPDSVYVFSITAFDTAGQASPTYVSDELFCMDCGSSIPTVPGTPTGTSTESSIDLTWAPSTDGDGTIAGYDVYQGSNPTPTRVTTNSLTVNGLTPNTAYGFKVEAIDNSGARGGPSAVGTVSTKPDTTRPTTPGTITATPQKTTAALSWGASTDNVGVTSYVVSGGGTATVTGTTANVTGLLPDTVYTFTVIAKDAAGNASIASSVTFRTKPAIIIDPDPRLRYSIAGSTAIKTLTKGTVPLRGSIAALFTVATGTFTADLALDDTSGRLTALGFLPVTAKIGFVPSGVTTGSLNNDSNILTSSSLVRIKVKEVKLFGAIPLAGGNNCQSKSLSKIDLKSTGAFDPLTGGTLTGVYAISDLNGCGALNGLVSPLTAGGGNTISLKLAYQAPQAIPAS